MRAFIALALLLAVSTVSAQTLTLTVYNTTNCAAGSVVTTQTVNTAICNTLQLAGETTYVKATCNTTTGVVVVSTFTDLNCNVTVKMNDTATNTMVDEVNSFNNTQCTPAEAITAMYTGCAVAPAVSSSSSTGAAPAGTSSTPAPAGTSSTPAPSGTSSTPAPATPKPSSSTGVQGSATQAAVSFFALAASAVVALL